ncbi:MAG: 6,7-dimethyl-8-ribityllumazine synthase [bacterium]|nr:6,7-dimethyl-8-ribityllumazine synthase [bacterium]
MRTVQTTKDVHDGVSGRVVIILADFNREIADGLLRGCEEVLREYSSVQWKVHRVPGAWEIPLRVQQLAREKQCDVIIALGCVIKGKTQHYDSVVQECARGCMDVSLREDIPVVYEVIATENEKDAQERSCGRGNKGRAAATVALDWLEKLS